MTFNNNMLMAGATANASGYSITNSARFVSGSSAYLHRTPGSSATNRKIFTLSVWVKRGKVGSGQYQIYSGKNAASDGDRLEFDDDKITMLWDDGTSGTLTTTAVYRDPAAWYHVVFVSDTTQATAADRAKLYINNVQVTAFGTASYPSLNRDGFINHTTIQRVASNQSPGQYFDGYMSNFHMIDGQALTPSSFGQTNTSGVWVPKAYAGTYGTNGFLMEFKNSAALGSDTSGNGNTFTSSGLVAGDQMTDTPTLNFCTLNPLITPVTSTISNGNLRTSGYTALTSTNATMGAKSGKWYFEYIANLDVMGGITGGGSSGTPIGSQWPGSQSNSYAWDSFANGGGGLGISYTNGSGTSYGANTSANDVVGVAFNLDTGSITFYKNNVSQGVAYSFTPSGYYYPTFRPGSATGVTVNFGQTAFTYTPPTGFVALNSTNLPAPAIKDGSAHFQTALHTGTGSAITINQSGNSTFTSDFVWTKGRSGATDHILSNIISGTGKYLKSNATTAETTDAQALTAFGAGSISYGTMAAVNTNAATYVDWMWKAGSTAVAGTGTGGASSVTQSPNTTAGISIVKGTTSGSAGTLTHGLGVAPTFVIGKRTDSTGAWQVFHLSLGASFGIYLNTTAASADVDDWNNTAPTSSVFSVGAITAGTYIFYCFAPIAGFSAFGSYTGNASADGPFIYTGFKPLLVIIKKSSAANSWWLQDGLITPYNVTTNALEAQAAGAEVNTNRDIDLYSNGFKIRNANDGHNGSGGTYIYAAFASNPFGGSGAAPATAR